MLKSLSIFTGNSNRALADEICKFVEIPLGRADVTHFSDGEIYVEIGENVRGVNCFVVQSTCSPPNEALMELLIMIDALKRAAPRTRTATRRRRSWSVPDLGCDIASMRAFR